jgi:hypothetical protein
VIEVSYPAKCTGVGDDERQIQTTQRSYQLDTSCILVTNVSSCDFDILTYIFITRTRVHHLIRPSSKQSCAPHARHMRKPLLCITPTWSRNTFVVSCILQGAPLPGTTAYLVSLICRPIPCTELREKFLQLHAAQISQCSPSQIGPNPGGSIRYFHPVRHGAYSIITLS